MKILEVNVDIGMVLKSRCMSELQYDINEQNLTFTHSYGLKKFHCDFLQLAVFLTEKGGIGMPPVLKCTNEIAF